MSQIYKLHDTKKKKKEKKEKKEVNLTERDQKFTVKETEKLVSNEQ